MVLNLMVGTPILRPLNWSTRKLVGRATTEVVWQMVILPFAALLAATPGIRQTAVASVRNLSIDQQT